MSAWRTGPLLNHSPETPSLRIDETLPLLPLALAVVLDLLPTLILFLELFSSTSSSFLGGTFSFPRPGRLTPRDSESSSSPLPRLGPPPPATAAFNWEGEASEGVLCVLVNVPARPLELELEAGEGRPSVMPPRVGSLLAFRRVDGRNIELDRVKGGFMVGVVADDRVSMGRVGVVNGCAELFDDALVLRRVGVAAAEGAGEGGGFSVSSCAEVARVRLVGPAMVVVEGCQCRALGSRRRLARAEIIGSKGRSGRDEGRGG